MPLRRPKPSRRRFGDLLDYLDHRLGGHHGSGPEYQFVCPFCIDRMGDESAKEKLWINFAKGAAHCFRCGYGSRDWPRFFRDLNGGALRMEEVDLIRGEVTLPAATVGVAQAVLDLFLPDPTEAAEALRPVALPREMIRLAPSCALATAAVPVRVRRGFRYLRERGVGRAKILRHDLGFCATGRYAQRVIFPVYQGGRVVYFTNRYCGSHPLKSLNPPTAPGEYTKAQCLLNYDNAVGAARVAVVEGPFDMLAFPPTCPAVALMGKLISDAQVRLLAALVPQGLHEVIVCLDADAGPDAEVVYRRLLRRVPHVRMLALDAGDPDERRAELPALLDAAPSTVSVAARVQGRFRRVK